MKKERSVRCKGEGGGRAKDRERKTCGGGRGWPGSSGVASTDERGASACCSGGVQAGLWVQTYTLGQPRGATEASRKALCWTRPPMKNRPDPS